MTTTIFDKMIGQTFDTVTGQRQGDEMVFTNTNGVHTFYHNQDCCESVSIDTIDGDVSDLVGSPILMAEEVDNLDAPDRGDEFYTWTFYKFATAKGSVTVRWYGSSNGYYGEGVSYAGPGERRY
jgi:hypothetical protein